MAQVIAERRDIDFVIHEQLCASDLCNHELFSEYNKKVIDLIINEARNLAIKELLPTMQIGDEKGCSYENGEVKIPQEFIRAWDFLKAGEWVAPGRSPEWGGQGMPETVAVAARDYLIGGNLSLLLLISLTHGAGHLIELFGTDEQKRLYLRKLYSGEWAGTMLLTEPEAGTDLAAISTTAVKNGDGTFSITGNKIFITFGEHDLAENIIHPVLARIEGAPEGSKGISLFLVPKYHVNGDGSLGRRNDIFCTGIEKKMGLHGSPTCSMSLGSKESCIGTLIGEENKGLFEMFVMMNEERLMVGSQSLSCASSSYLHALAYARTRVQGSLPASSESKSLTIIHHPDVRRMLLTMKMYTEGMRSLIYYIANCEDEKRIAKSQREKEKCQDLIDVLIPVGKGYVSDRAVDVCNIGIQVFGGYGYTKEYPVEQLLRDVRIAPIYEGTNGIQALDLLGRKLNLKNGQLIKTLIAEMKKTISEAKKVDLLQSMAAAFETALDAFEVLSVQMGNALKSPDVLSAFTNASLFLDVTGDLTLGWMLLWRAKVAAQKMEKGAPKKDQAFYDGQIKSFGFYTATVLPLTQGRMTALENLCCLPIEMLDESFGGK